MYIVLKKQDTVYIFELEGPHMDIQVRLRTLTSKSADPDAASRALPLLERWVDFLVGNEYGALHATYTMLCGVPSIELYVSIHSREELKHLCQAQTVLDFSGIFLGTLMTSPTRKSVLHTDLFQTQYANLFIGEYKHM